MTAWLLTSIGVGVVVLTLVAARLTRPPEQPEDDTPTEGWEAFTPRSFDELEPQRARLWPILAGFTGMVLLTAGVAQVQRNSGPRVEAEATPRPYIVEVQIAAAPTPVVTPAPTPKPTPVPTAKPTPKPAPATTPQPAAQPQASAGPGAAPTVELSASCSDGTVKASFTARAQDGASLQYYTLYVDGEVGRGGPVSGAEYSGSYQKDAGAGPHDVEVVVEDDAGHSSVKRAQATCG